MEDEEIISRTTKLLEQGCTMLATHHDCGAPLFRCKGEVVCPVCSFSPGKNEGKVNKDAPLGEIFRETKTDEVKLTEQAIRRTVLDKLMELNENLKAEQDLAKLRGLLDCIEAALCVMRSLKE